MASRIRKRTKNTSGRAEQRDSFPIFRATRARDCSVPRTYRGCRSNVRLLYAKYQPDETGTSLSCIINSVSFPSFRFGEKFPYAKASESEIYYLSFWVYNDVGSDLYLISSGDLLNRQLLRSGLWNRVVFYTDSFSSSFDWKKNQFTVYGVDNAADRINGALYFDDLRIYRDGDVEEAAFSEQITTTDYNAATGEGVRFALNGSYRIDFRVFGLDGTLLEGEESSVLWVKDSNGANMVVNGGSFTPAREGWHTLSLYYEKDGIHNSVIKKFYVRPQLEFNPDTDARDAVLPYGEAETVYNADSFRPVLWNKGKVAGDGDVKYSLTVTDGSGKKVETNGLVFTPMKKGLYNLSFYAQDAQTKEFATYSLKLGVFEKGKEGMAYDFGGRGRFPPSAHLLLVRRGIARKVVRGEYRRKRDQKSQDRSHRRIGERQHGERTAVLSHGKQYSAKHFPDEIV